MTSALKITLAAMGAALDLVATGCGGSDESVPDGVIAVVGDSEVTKAELDKYIGYAKKGYEASKQEFPKVGTPEYQNEPRAPASGTRPRAGQRFLLGQLY